MLAVFLVAVLLVQNLGFVEISAATKKLAAPKVTAKVSQKNKSVKISISKTKGASWYVIEMKSDKDSKFTKIKKLNKDGTAKRTYTKKKLAEGTYSFRVRAYTKDGSKTIKSSYSKVVTVTVGTKPSSDVPDFSKIDLTDYESLGTPFGGIIPVCKDEMWGAIDYSGKEVVPCEYLYFQSANNAGYFILYDGDWESHLFNNKGKEIATCGGDFKQMVASTDGYVIASDASGMDGYQTRYEYYDYNGKLLNTIESGYGMEIGIGDLYDNPKGFYDGKSIVTGNIKDYVYKKEEDGTVSCIRPFDFGLVDGKGKVTWIDGDGIDEEADGYLSYDEIKDELSSLKIGIDAYEEVALNAPVEGYFLSSSFNPEIPGYYLRDAKGNIICSIFPQKMSIDGDKLVYDISETDGEGRKIKTYVGTEKYYKAELQKFYYDGSYFYNYGSKIVISVDDKYALIDLSAEKLEYKIFEDIELSPNKLWLIEQDGLIGYCDHDGNIVKLFNGATEFTNGYAFVIDQGELVFLVNENLEIVKDMGFGESVYSGGGLFAVKNGDLTFGYAFK
ncbi:MAG: fibronectin type III domain-containing protein [Lachnospiraceae bacterium]|nr:fibronectin type III domain-containing protein [Lachnospiraceae bacterium]